MKKIPILLVLVVLAPAFGGAQSIRISPFEGKWALDEQEDAETDYTELIFFGNVMLYVYNEEPMIYSGMNFTHTNSTIIFPSDSAEWQYSLSGNTLTITTDDAERLHYTRVSTAKNPIEGIWRVSDKDSGEDYLMLFTADIMAIGQEDEYMGVRIKFDGKWLQVSPEYGAAESQSSRMEYTLSGRSLTFRVGGEEVELNKVY